MTRNQHIDTDFLPGNKMIIRASGFSLKELQEYRKKHGGSLHGAGNIHIAKGL
tara:strand:- start:585 stop:743 length:159 start_codon:yes stop_codon:yes gene_type:complete